MRVVIAGGTGFLGQTLASFLQRRGDEVRILTRRPSAPNHVGWTPSDRGGAWTDEISGADAVVNLVGEAIDKQRWTAERKAVLVESRLGATRAIVGALADRQSSAVLLSASAVGYYGPCGDQPVSETSPPGDDFLALLCRDWEGEATKASTRGRVVLLRTGLLLDTREGALGRLMLPFRLGLGGPMGTGDQFWPWIHRDDWARLAVLALDDARVAGAINLTAPEPVTNREFVRALGRALGRPAVLPAPAFALRLLLGEMGEALALNGQRAVPRRAQELGFSFEYPEIDAALRALIAEARA